MHGGPVEMPQIRKESLRASDAEEYAPQRAPRVLLVPQKIGEPAKG